MDSNITIKIVEPGSGPIDPVVPNTGLFTNGVGGPEATIIVVSAVILLVALIAAVLYYRKKKQGKVDSLSTLLKTLLNSTKHKKAITLGLVALALLVSVGTLATLIKTGVQAIDTEEDNNTPETSEALETTSTAKVEDGELVVELGDTPVFAYIPTTITVDEEMSAGYTLKAYSESPTLSSEGTDKTISLVTIPEDEYENAGSLTTSLIDNTWGLAVEEPESQEQEIYFSLPDNADEAIVIKSIDDYSPTPAGDTTTVYYGVYITPDMPYGTYTGATVSYDVEPNRTDLATVTFDSNGLYFDNNKTTNVVRYGRGTTSATELHSHTLNLNDAGEVIDPNNRMYPINTAETFVYDFADADKVNVQIVKTGNDSCSYVGGIDTDAYFSFWVGNHPDYTAEINYSDGIKAFGNTTGKYVFGDYNNVQTDVNDASSITFAYHVGSGGSSRGCGSGYGYYAVITATDAEGNPAYAIGNVQYSGNYKTPTTTEYPNYEFLGWSLDPNATSADFADAADIEANMALSAGEKVTLYAVWSPIVSFNYDGNNATAGSMESTSYNGDTPTTVTLAHEDIKAGNTIDLYAPNYKKTGYGFVGWSTDQNAWEDLTDDDEANDPTIYGPNQTFTVTKDMLIETVKTGKDTLYAIWAPAETENGSPVALQNWTGCSNLTATTYDTETGTLTVGKNTITALTDNRDGNVYTIARLSDGNCWMTENLRLNNEATISTTNTNNPLTVDNNVTIKNNDGNTYNHLSPNTNSWCTNSSTECYNQSYLNTFNTNLGGQDAIASYNGSYDSEKAFQWYSYGNYYNWYSATAGNGTYRKGSGEVVGDICPAGWILPIGNVTSANGSFSNLDSNMGGTGSGHSGSNNWRSFPNNFVYSGYWGGSSASNRGSYGSYWSSTAIDTYGAYGLYFYSGNVNPGTDYNNKSTGSSVRCVAPVQ